MSRPTLGVSVASGGGFSRPAVIFGSAPIRAARTRDVDARGGQRVAEALGERVNAGLGIAVMAV